MSSLVVERQSRLRVLDDRKPTWRLPDDPVVEEVIVPALQVADEFLCMVGFFGGGALRELSHGLAAYIVRGRHPVRLLASPVISESDQEAIQLGIRKPAEVLADAIAAAFKDEVTLQSALAEHTGRCLAFLLATDRLRMKVVHVRNAKFHLKEWIFRSEPDVVVLSGSANFTGSALAYNVEKLNLHRSWRGGDNATACEDTLEDFDLYWANRKSGAIAIDLPVAVREQLLSSYESAEPPTEDDYRRALEAEQRSRGTTHETWDLRRAPSRVNFQPPAGLVWETGTYAHQGQAIFAWENASRRGILAMATGAGKTITALVAAWRLYREVRKLLIVIVAPTRPLVSQWADEVRRFGLEPYVPSRDSKLKRLRTLDARLSSLELGVTTVEAFVVTNDLLGAESFRALLERQSVDTLLIGDEVHNLGTAAFLADPPEYIAYRMGLSATPQRQYDDEGSAGLERYFGDVVFEFGLDKAIGVCLVPYDYHLHLVELTHEELEQYRKLTQQLRRLMGKSGASSNDEDARKQQRLLNRRRLVLEDAENKLAVLERVVRDLGARDLRHALFYATGKAPTQLERVNALLRDLGIRFHQITADETGNASLVDASLEAFRSGGLQALTAKLVLDEGLNVPEITTAFILASTTGRRQWVQRRGRVLRLCPAIGKESASLHDFIVLPPADEARDEDAKRFISSELQRCDDFAELARNRAAAHGPRETLQDIRLRYIV
jgi:superfamily II DNA or RNA helicase